MPRQPRSRTDAERCRGRSIVWAHGRRTTGRTPPQTAERGPRRSRANGLEYRVIDTGDAAVFDPYLQAEMRGFLAGEQTEEQLGGARDGLAFRRFVGVYDPALARRRPAGGTVNSWVTDLTLPGGRGIPMWAIAA